MCSWQLAYRLWLYVARDSNACGLFMALRYGEMLFLMVVTMQLLCSGMKVMSVLAESSFSRCRGSCDGFLWRTTLKSWFLQCRRCRARQFP